jgi:hypothetical protein
MNRFAENSRILGVLALAAVFALGITALLPAKAEAAFCSFSTRTVSGWGTGFSCYQAMNACEDDAYGKAPGECPFGICEYVSFYYTNECVYQGGGNWFSDCRLTFKCWKDAF